MGDRLKKNSSSNLSSRFKPEFRSVLIAVAIRAAASYPDTEKPKTIAILALSESLELCRRAVS
jgi:hypothetical protein